MSIANQLNRINLAKNDIKNVVNKYFNLINNEKIDSYTTKISELIEKFKVYIPKYISKDGLCNNAIPFECSISVDGNCKKNEKNIFDGITESGGYNNATGEKTVNAVLLRNANPIYIKPNTDYKISNNSVDVLMNVLEYKSDATFIRSYQHRLGEYITTSTEANYINIFRGITEFDKVQIEEGRIITEYEEPNKIETVTSVALKKYKNYFENKYIDSEKYGITLIVNEDKTITLNGNGTNTGDYDINLVDIFSLFGDNKTLKIKNMSGSATGQITFALTDNNWGNIKRVDIANSTHNKILSLTENIEYTRSIIRISPNCVINNLVFSIQVVEEPEVYHIDLQGNELCSINDIKDKLLISDKGLINIDKVIEKIMLNGSEDWYYKADTRTFEVNLLAKNDADSIITMSDNFICCPYNRRVAPDYINKPRMYYNVESLKLIIRDISLNNLDDFKNWLSQDNVTVYYEKAESQIIELDLIEPIKMLDGTNIFDLETNIDTTFEVEYYIDYKKEKAEVE